MKQLIYKLINVREAIENKNRGLKLTYEVKTRFVTPLSFGSFIMYIPHFKRAKKETVTFLQPFKKAWNTHRHFLPPNFWGKKNKPFTNLWLTTSLVVDSGIYFTIVKSIVKDQDLIDKLKKRSKNFKLIINQNQNGKRKSNGNQRRSSTN